MGTRACAPSFASVVVQGRLLQRIWCTVDDYGNCAGLVGIRQFLRVRYFLLLLRGQMHLQDLRLLRLHRMLLFLVHQSGHHLVKLPLHRDGYELVNPKRKV